MMAFPKEKPVAQSWSDRVTSSRESHTTSKTPIKRRSHTDELIARSGHLIHKLKAKDSTGRWAYYFVLVEPHNERAFLDALKSEESIDLEDYGKVIASCYGEEPNDHVKQLLQDKYGFNV